MNRRNFIGRAITTGAIGFVLCLFGKVFANSSHSGKRMAAERSVPFEGARAPGAPGTDFKLTFPVVPSCPDCVKNGIICYQHFYLNYVRKYPRTIDESYRVIDWKVKPVTHKIRKAFNDLAMFGETKVKL